MSFSIFNNDIILCSADSVIIFNLKRAKETTIELPKLNVDKNTKHNNTDIEYCHGITSVKFSSDGQYFCVCTNRKQLCLYKWPENNLIRNITLARAASKVQFTPHNDLIVADKSGDVYLYETDVKCTKDTNESNKSDGLLLLGHLSMLLDVLITRSSRFIITADRDEKIRVSRFPNAYNIESYCLGHTKFVNNILELPHDTNVLVSAGGDGEFKFWDYKIGEELMSVSYWDQVDDDDIKKLNENLHELDLLTEEVSALPVKHIRLMLVDVNSSILCLSFYGNGNLLLYHITGCLESNKFDVNFVHKIIEDTEPLECLFYDEQFWILQNNGLKVYKKSEDNKKFVEDIEFNKTFEKLNKSWTIMRSNINESSFYSLLYKRKFDNVQEYQERKKSRLMNTAE